MSRKLIQVTPQQRDNLWIAMWRWLETKPEEVVPNLYVWQEDLEPTCAPSCSSPACLGGHLAWWPEFRAQGIYADKYGAPRGPAITQFCVALSMLGDDALFDKRNRHPADKRFTGTDHELVGNRLDWLLANSKVVDLDLSIGIGA